MGGSAASEQVAVTTIPVGRSQSWVATMLTAPGKQRMAFLNSSAVTAVMIAASCAVGKLFRHGRTSPVAGYRIASTSCLSASQGRDYGNGWYCPGSATGSASARHDLRGLAR